jgi:hypothetical protein
MMWEESRGVESPWNGYLKDLPNQFDTLMFWNDEELALLQASAIKGQSMILVIYMFLNCYYRPNRQSGCRAKLP